MISILILDDNKDSNESFKDSALLIEDHEIIIDAYEKLEDAMLRLNVNCEYDFAVVDISLTGNYSDEGNDFLEHLSKKYNILPIAYTGQPSKVKGVSKLMDTWTRGEDGVTTETVLKKIVDIYDTGITRILGEKGSLASYLDNFYWEILGDIFGGTKQIVESKIGEQALTRLFINHVYSNFYMEDEELHPDELYMKKTGGLCNGSIISYNDSMYLVITPRCTMSKSKNLQLVEIEPMNIARSIVCDINGTEMEKVGERKEQNYKDLVNGKNLKYHYLPKSTLFKGGVINFEKIIYLKKKDIENQYIVDVVIANEFMRNITNRFSMFYSRQGQPVFAESIGHLVNS